MKAQTKVCSATSRMAAHFGFTASEHYRISKHRPENGEAEMQACFHKLKELVPTVPQNKNVSKVQLLQHVIDYILDLELTLDFSPLESADTPPPEMLPASAHQLPGRRPLAESSSINTPIPQETSHLAPEMDIHEQQCDSRPASC